MRKVVLMLALAAFVAAPVAQSFAKSSAVVLDKDKDKKEKSEKSEKGEKKSKKSKKNGCCSSQAEEAKKDEAKKGCSSEEKKSCGSKKDGI